VGILGARRRSDGWRARHPLEGRTLLFVRLVYLVLLPLCVVGLIAAGDGFWAVVLLVSAGISIVRAPRDRRDRLLGRRA